MKQLYEIKNDYEVLVKCFTYNQSKYIKQTLDGFAMQETDFPFVCLIIDDASTDMEQDVIKAWMRQECKMEQSDCMENEESFITIVPHKTNVSCTFAFFLLKTNLNRTGEKEILVNNWRKNCKYETVCEGDDYWIDKDKLQMQVDFLEQNQDYSLCYTAYNVVDEHGNLTHNRYRELICYEGNVFDRLLQTNFIQLATIMSKCSLIENAINNINEKGLRSYDYALFLELSLVGNFGYINSKTTCYRICAESASHSDSLLKKIKFALSLQRIRNTYYILKYGGVPKIKEYYNILKLCCIVSIKHLIRNIYKFNK